MFPLQKFLTDEMLCNGIRHSADFVAKRLLNKQTDKTVRDVPEFVHLKTSVLFCLLPFGS